MKIMEYFSTCGFSGKITWIRVEPNFATILPPCVGLPKMTNCVKCMYLPVYSEEEVKRMTQAFENPQFKELFLDYVKEIENPDNKAKYEEEIRQMERERGIDAKFIHPTPKECLHTKEHILQMNAFVNIGKKYG